MKVRDVITPKHKYIIDAITKQVNSHPTKSEVVWKILQTYFVKLAGRVK